MARESKLNSYSDSQLRELGPKGLFELGLYASVNGAWNALYLKPNGRLCDEGPAAKATAQTAKVANAKPVTVKAQTATVEFIGPPVEKLLPGRIEVLLEMLGHDVHLTGVLSAIEENAVAWCTQVRKMGEDERALMRDYTGMNSWTLADIAHEKREEKRNAPFKTSAETVAKFASIDSGLVQRELRFESSRYDSDIVTFYLAD